MTTFEQQTGTANPFDGSGFDVGRYSKPIFADLDGDGDLDAVVGERDNGTLTYFENTGSATEATYIERTGTANPFNGFISGSFSTPTFVDVDGDSDLDLVVGDFNGTLDRYYENTGSTTEATFIERTGTANPFAFNSLGSVGSFSAPTFADLDGDDDLDIVVGDGNGALNYFENTGSATEAIYIERTGTANPFDGIDLGDFSAPTFADVDGDGDLDAVVGALDGTLTYFENTGSATEASFTVRTGTANPFDGIDVGSWSAPTFADLDGDGDLDLVVGERDGTLLYYENTTPIPLPTPTNDFNGDGSTDIVWRNQQTGANYIWYLDDGSITGEIGTLPVETVGWFIEGIGDFDQDGSADDLLWHQYGSGGIYLWITDPAGTDPTVGDGGSLGNLSPTTGWLIQDVGDFDADGYRDDLLWFNQNTADISLWTTEDGVVTGFENLSTGLAGTGWAVVSVGDFDGDSYSDDVVWRNSQTGENAVWLLDEGEAVGYIALDPEADTTWQIAGVGNFDGSGIANDLLWQNSASGAAAVWLLDNANTVVGFLDLGIVGTQWQAVV